MENFKIEHFKRDNPTKDFPCFSTLKSIQAKEIYNKISESIGGFFPPDQLVKKIDEIGVVVESNNADSDDFNLKEVFDTLGIQPQERVYLNWYRFDNIDEIRFDDLTLHFDDIWYPGPDELDIFDASFSWIVSISHHGSIKVVKMEEKK